MDVVHLSTRDTSWNEFEADWTRQCEEVDEEFASYGLSTMSVIRDFAAKDADKEWAIAIKDGNRFMAAACAMRANQKGLTGWTLRIREVTVCPFLDYGNLDENSYVDTLIEILNGAVKLSESDLLADHIKLHLRSPADAVFFRAFGHKLGSKDVFAATETHGAWLTLSKASSLHLVK